jgi:tryptophan halogenase
MLNTLPVLTGMRLQGEAVTSALAPGYRPRPWIGNCVAIGEAAVALEPLDAVSLHIVQTGLSHLISFFPVDADHMLEAGVYNAGLTRHAENIRDFQIAHYRLNQRRDEPFWDRAREMSLPPTLDYKMQLFSARGAVALYDDEAFQASNWASIFIGHGLMPRAYDPLVDMLPHDDQVMQLKRMLSFIAQEVKAMPALESQLRPAQPRTNALY